MKDTIMTIIIIVNVSFNCISAMPQILRLYNRKTSDDISKGSWVLYSITASLDTLYSFMIGDLGLIVYSFIDMIFNFTILGLTIYYRVRKDNQ